MRKKKEFKLIVGEFTPADAKEVLINLFSSKLSFHQMKNFSATERFGKNDETAMKRIPELKESITDITAFVEEAAESRKKLVITAFVNIEFAGIKI